MKRLKATHERVEERCDLAFVQNDILGHEDLRANLPLFERCVALCRS